MRRKRVVCTEQERFKYIFGVCANLEKSFFCIPCEKVLSLLSVHQSPSLLAILVPPAMVAGWLVAFSQEDEILDDIKHE